MGHLRDPLLPDTPVASRRNSLKLDVPGLRKHDSVLEQLVASQPLHAGDVLYPTNIAVAATRAATPRREFLYQVKLDEILESLPAQRLAGLVTASLFAGYAALFSLQHVIKVWFGIPDDDSSASHHFSFAITSLYVWNLVFRLGHNVLLRPFSPRRRALIGLCSMAISMLVLALVVFHLGFKSTLVVAVAYAFGGIAVGTFETNYSVVLAALGHRTKIFGISGIPVGIFLVIVPGFIAVTAGLPVVYIYWCVLGLLVVGVGVLLYGLNFPDIDWLVSSDEEESIPGEQSPTIVAIDHPHSSRTERWMLPVVSVGLVFTLNMMFVSAFSPGVLLYLYNGATVSVAGTAVSTGYFLATFSSFGFVADVLSRKRIYAKKPEHHPVRFLALTAAGVGVILLQNPLIAPLGTFLVFYANGSIYAQSCRWMDRVLDAKVLVMANSVFFFLGDCGSVIGAVLIPFIRDAMAPIT